MLGEVLEDDADAPANGDVPRVLHGPVRCNQIPDDPDGLVCCWPTPLLVQLHQHHRIGRIVLEAGLDRVSYDLVGVDRAAPAHRLPRPLERHTPGTGVGWRITQKAAGLAAP